MGVPLVAHVDVALQRRREKRGREHGAATGSTARDGASWGSGGAGSEGRGHGDARKGCEVRRKKTPGHSRCKRSLAARPRDAAARPAAESACWCWPAGPGLAASSGSEATGDRVVEEVQDSRRTASRCRRTASPPRAPCGRWPRGPRPKPRTRPRGRRQCGACSRSRVLRSSAALVPWQLRGSTCSAGGGAVAACNPRFAAPAGERARAQRGNQPGPRPPLSGTHTRVAWGAVRSRRHEAAIKDRPLVAVGWLQSCDCGQAGRTIQRQRAARSAASRGRGCADADRSKRHAFRARAATHRLKQQAGSSASWRIPSHSPKPGCCKSPE